jgi:hypothetical protein
VKLRQVEMFSELWLYQGVEGSAEGSVEGSEDKGS